ncbi:carbon-nitrogen hydrolase family protein [Marinobacterium marinum]|uniref:Carbon-nitrogen hydrolase family protein n=1 Tax=Marinobacterium marinum TaxID=2756129 RepID=A0A7W1WV77_9GAMM|nr:carbon-nitrogen hydrolase family protein [Marinobacterium marinum]MBA4500844.1 carbon-nitrogen hydrolase family protein [Marinobacterium marinum]
MKFNAAISQKPPVLLDLKASIDLAVDIIAEAARADAKLIVFPEAFLPGYPTWIWRLKPGADMSLGNEIHTRLRENAVDINHGVLKPIQTAAAEQQVVVVIGINELDSRYSGSTLYNSVVVIDSNGKMANRHRKLMPTNPERMVWGMGDASGLRVVDTAVGRIGCLICWENYMPLARFALYTQNMDILIAPTWDSGPAWIGSMNHIAREGGCWVLSTGTALHTNDLPEHFPGRKTLFGQPEWINPGDAVIVRPFGGAVAGPLHESTELLIGEIDTEQARQSRKALDVAGHYGRPDIFQLSVNRSRQAPVRFSDESD